MKARLKGAWDRACGVARWVNEGITAMAYVHSGAAAADMRALLYEAVTALDKPPEKRSPRENGLVAYLDWLADNPSRSWGS